MRDDAQAIRVPVQVKSSFVGKMLFLEKHPEFVLIGGIVIRVNEHRTDEEIIEELRCKLNPILRHRIGFEGFYAKIARKERIAKKRWRDTESELSSKEQKRMPVPYKRGGAGESRWKKNTLPRHLSEYT